MQIYLVGGALRDELLGIPVTERDWVVVGAGEAEMLALGYRPVAGDFPVFLHPDTGEEYALARRETKVGVGYHGFSVDTGADVTLEEDLARRDLTVNAMARGGDGVIVDPYGGRKDLQEGLLRHVTPAFSEDPLRVLRVARFAAKLGGHGFRVAHPTHALMKQMATDPDLTSLPPERVWRELRRSLDYPQPWRFFEVLQACGALVRLLPTVATLMTAGGHGGDTSEAVRVLQRAVARGVAPELRLALFLSPLLQDPDAPQRLAVELRMERTFSEDLRRLQQAKPFLLREGGAKAGELLSLAQQLKLFQQPERVDWLLSAQAILRPDLVSSEAAIRQAIRAAAELDAAELAAEGFAGRALGEELSRRREAAIAGVLAYDSAQSEDAQS